MREVTFFIVAVATVSACGAPATYADVQKTWDQSCATAGCHKGSAAGAGLNLEGDSHSRLVGARSTLDPTLTLVVAGKPDQSFLIEKLERATPSQGTQMPPGAPLTADEIAVIRAWITAGASKD